LDPVLVCQLGEPWWLSLTEKVRLSIIALIEAIVEGKLKGLEGYAPVFRLAVSSSARWRFRLSVPRKVIHIVMEYFNS